MLVGDFDEARLDTPDFVQTCLQEKLGSLSAKVRWDYLVSHHAPQRLHEVLLSSSVQQAHVWLLALPVPRLGQSMLRYFEWVGGSCGTMPVRRMGLSHLSP